MSKTNESIKSESLTIGLAVVGGLFFLMGLGHLYVGCARKGLPFLFVGLAVGASGFAVPLELDEPKLILHFSLTYLIIWIWHILDARYECLSYNSRIVSEN